MDLYLGVLVAALFLGVAIHEAGHLLCALLLDFKIANVRVGICGGSITVRGWAPAWKHIIVYAGGPQSSLATGYLMLHETMQHPLTVIFGIVNLLLFGISALPHRTTDGRAILMLLLDQPPPGMRREGGRESRVTTDSEASP